MVMCELLETWLRAEAVTGSSAHKPRRQDFRPYLSAQHGGRLHKCLLNTQTVWANEQMHSIHNNGQILELALCKTCRLFASLICSVPTARKKPKAVCPFVSPWIRKLKFSMITIHTGVMFDQNPSERCQAHSQTGKYSQREFYISFAEQEQKQMSFTAALSGRTQWPLSSRERESLEEKLVAL